MLDAELIKKLKINLTDTYSKAMAALDELGQTETPTLDAERFSVVCSDSSDFEACASICYGSYSDLGELIEHLEELKDGYREAYEAMNKLDASAWELTKCA